QMRVIPVAVIVACLPLCAQAAQPALTYDRCLTLVGSNASAAFSQASTWESAGGGAAAIHCEALALVSLRRYGEAATKLDTLGRSTKADATTRAAILDQAGNAWLLTKSASNAEASFTAALALAPRNADMLVDRARSRALAHNWSGADADLTSALAVVPTSAEVLVLRASARHALGQKAQARADIDRALDLRPGYAEALVERGALKQEAGDSIGAKADWQQVISSSPNTGAADSARAYLQNVQTTPSSGPAVAQ
ncbi:MAG TPA: hypothetical protein VH000_11030, partial [Rhizomicrobium sp.]|nr:hypothetical protein [Rhizomicrobium sp.]